jgi:UDP-N-acetylmuramate--alanine ligase
MTHLIGIGGVGMSALAEALIALGHTVSGSDRLIGTVDQVLLPPSLKRLNALGIDIKPDDGSGINASVKRIIVSTAIEDGNPGLVKAKEIGIPVIHRATALSEALSPFKLVAVAGTCGKSTVTAMLAHVLKSCGMDPFAVNGAAVVGWNGSILCGEGDYAVAEVDESDKSLTAFKPYAVIVTNSSSDHYSKDEMDSVFDAFIGEVKGPIIDGRHGKFDADSSLPGAHNRQNAGLTLAMAIALGADETAARTALLNFPGVERRMQFVGLCDGAEVYDDYAHNPEKLQAMMTTLQERHEKGVAVLWRPHGYGPLKKMLGALSEMFNNVLRPQDRLILLPVYDAGGTADRSLNSDRLAELIPGAVFIKTPEEATALLKAQASAFGAIVTAGARDPALPVIAQHLAGKEQI